MQNFKRFRLACALVAIAGVTNADVVIDNQNIPGSDISAITISPGSGTMFITTVPGYTVTKNVVGDNVTITSFFANPASISEGNATTINWATQNADSCSASNDGGITGWSGAVTLNGPKSVTISTPGNYTFTLTCEGTGGPVSETTSVTVTAADAVTIDSFFASPAGVTEGDSTTITWTTTNATSCTASGGFDTWGGAVSLDGTQLVTSSVQGGYTFTLTCEGTGGPAEATTTVTVSAVGAACDPSPLTGSTSLWADFWGVQFPTPRYQNEFMSIGRYSYKAVKFNTGNVIDNGTLLTVETTSTDGIRLGAISQCPGDFDVPAACQHVWGIGGSITWATDGTVGGCQLEPNTDYYFNLTFTDGFDNTSSSCRETPCITKVQHINF